MDNARKIKKHKPSETMTFSHNELNHGLTAMKNINLYFIATF